MFKEALNDCPFCGVTTEKINEVRGAFLGFGGEFFAGKECPSCMFENVKVFRRIGFRTTDQIVRVIKIDGYNRRYSEGEELT